jgi:preprotein translocase subunit SecD
MSYPVRSRGRAWQLIVVGLVVGTVVAVFCGMALQQARLRRAPRLHVVLAVQREAVFVFSAPELAGASGGQIEEDLYSEIGRKLTPEAVTTKRIVDLRLSGEGITVRTRARDEAEMARQRDRIQQLLAELFPGVRVVKAELSDTSTADLTEAKRIIERRLRSHGFRATVVEVEPPDRIAVDLPTTPRLRDPARVTDRLVITGLLQFRAVPRKYAFGDEHRPQVSANGEVTGFTVADAVVPVEQVLAESPVIATSRDLEPNSRVLSATHVQVSFELVGAGRDRFREYTRANINHYIAIVLDGKMISCPLVRAAIPGEGVIEGGFDGPGGLEEARDLSVLLNAGALTVDLECVESRVVPPRR